MSILEEILEYKQQEIALAKKTVQIEQLKEMPDFTRKCFSFQRS